MTPLGREILAEARDILLKCDNIAAIKRRYGAGGGDLRIGTTHLQARYIMPAVVRQYLRKYPDANIQIFQSAPENLVEMLENNLVDIVICTELLENHPRLGFHRRLSLESRRLDAARASAGGGEDADLEEAVLLSAGDLFARLYRTGGV